MKFALKDGKYVNIRDVERGLKCGCVCPVCGEPLVARKGNILSHTFAHTSDSKCANFESSLHWSIKESVINYIGKDLKLCRGIFEEVVTEGVRLFFFVASRRITRQVFKTSCS